MLPNRIKTEFGRSYVVQERCIQDFGGGGPRERDHVGDLGVDKRVIQKWILNT